MSPRRLGSEAAAVSVLSRSLNSVRLSRLSGVAVLIGFACGSPAFVAAQTSPTPTTQPISGLPDSEQPSAPAATAPPSSEAERNAPAGPTEPILAAQPYWVRATSDRLNVRAMPDTNSLVVVKLERDTVLRAVGQIYTWTIIDPPPGVFSLVSAEYVKETGPGEGEVDVSPDSSLRVRAGSLVAPVNPLESPVQTRLEAGTKLRILGEEDGWYKIEPPAGTRLYVATIYLEQISADEADRLGLKPVGEPLGANAVRGEEPAAAPNQMTEEPAAELESEPEAPVATTQPVTARPAVEAEPRRPALAGPAAGRTSASESEVGRLLNRQDTVDRSGRWGQELILAELRMQMELSKPGDERRWREVLTALEPIGAQRDEPMVAGLANEYVLAIQTDQKAVTETGEPIASAQRETAPPQPTSRPVVDVTQRPVGEAVNQVIIRGAERVTQDVQRERVATTHRAASGRFLPAYSIKIGERGLRYRLVQPVSGKVTAYLELPADLGVEAAELVGKYVGIEGEAFHEAGVKPELVRVTRLTVVDPAGAASKD